MSLLISYRQLICSFDLVPGQKKAASSKTEMLRFALPALGIYLANPIMSNIDPLASLTFCVGCLTWFDKPSERTGIPDPNQAFTVPCLPSFC